MKKDISKKGAFISASSILLASALTPAVSSAAETPIYENAAPGFYNVSNAKVYLATSFIFLDGRAKYEILIDPNFYFADGKGNVIRAIDIANANSNGEVDEKMELQKTVEDQYNVRLTADGKVIFLTKEGYIEELENALKEAQEKLDQVAQEHQQAVKDAIKAAEDALNDANASIEDLQDAIKQLKDAIKNAGISPVTELINNNEETLGLVGTTAVSSNEKVATAVISEGKIVLTAGSPGTAAVTVSNTDGNKATINISVSNDGKITVNSILKYKSSKNTLRDTVNNASNYQESYFTPETWSPFANALAEAKAELASGNSVETTINTALTNLKDAIETLEYKTIPYTIGDNTSASQITLTFTQAVNVDGPIEVTGGTVANANVNVSNEGKVLSVTTLSDAIEGETIKFNLDVGNKPVPVTMIWNGNDWSLTTEKNDVFESTINPDLGSVIELQLLGKSGQLIDGEVKLEDLLSNPNLLRLNLLPGSGLVAGDVLKLAAPGFELLNIKLTEEDLSRGFVDAGVTTELLNSLTGGENLDLSLVVTRGVTDVLNGTVGSLPLPEFLTKPVINAVDEITDNVVGILKGETTFDVNIPTVGADKLKAGDELMFNVRRPGIKLPLLPALGAANTETKPIIITPDDISNGYVKASFESENLVSSLLGGVGNLLGSLTGGTSIFITPVMIEDGNEVAGEEVEVKITNGLLRQLLER